MSNIFYKDFDINLSRIKRRNKNDNIIINIENDNNMKKIENEKLSSLKYYSKINNNKEMKLIYDSSKTNENNNFISLINLYTLPNNKTKTHNFLTRSNKELRIIHNKKKQRRNDIYNNVNNNFRFITIGNNPIIHEEKKENINNEHILNKNKRTKTIDQFANLPNFMKHRFYSDIEEKLNYRFRNKAFHYDVSLKNKIIQLSQIREFWGGISDYTNPILCTKRVRYLSKLIEDRKNLRKKNENIKNKENERYYKLLKKRNRNTIMPKLCTNSNLTEKRREEINKIRYFGKERKNITEDNMVYVI